MQHFDLYTLARFWSKVRVGRLTECWTWGAGASDAGYGRFKINGRLESPHRLAYSMLNGPIPDDTSYHGKVVMHRCDNPRCVNPNHLKLGSQSDNVQDMVEKGRDSRAAKGARLAPEVIAAVVNDPRPIREAAKIYGVSRTHICRLRKMAKTA